MTIALPDMAPEAPAQLWDRCPDGDQAKVFPTEHLMRRVLAGITDIDSDKTVDADLVLVQEAFDTPPTWPEREVRMRAEVLHGVLERRIHDVRHLGLLLDDASVGVIRQADAAVKATFADPYAALRRRAVVAEALLELLGT